MELLTMGLLLAACVAGMELFLVRTLRPEKFKGEQYPPATRWAWQLVHRLGPWIEKSPLHSLGFSLALSLAIGVMFPAAGVMVMLAGVASTLITQPYYGIKRKVVAFKSMDKKTMAKMVMAHVRKH